MDTKTALETLSERDRIVAERVGRRLASTWPEWTVADAAETVAVGLAAWRAYEGEGSIYYAMGTAIVATGIHPKVAEEIVESTRLRFADLRAEERRMAQRRAEA